MPKNKSFYNNKTLLAGAALIGGFLVYKSIVNKPREAGSGSLGGTDELLGQQGFDIDPNVIPEQEQEFEWEPNYITITEEGALNPDNPTNIPSNIPIASTGTGTLFNDAAAVSGAIGANLLLPSIAKRINKLIDTK